MAKVKKGDRFEETTGSRQSGYCSVHYQVDEVKGSQIKATPFKWGGCKGQIVPIGKSRTFTSGPNGSLPANCVKVRVR